ncbi:MAG: hypothetical protein COU25_01665 [Candidatus Levybacteria bacterium CG10_big_fil_rev_8_21_14_0_10_35_13]|nr:MAG: hypothetical protein COU25_01665 [Candidatus Levybacteria bacterium CG10_big_fil_rev_8_21_14_0_10_35_13]
MKRRFNILFLLLLILTIPSVVGLLHSGFPLTDDGNWMVIRLSAFYENLRDGQFPVRFLSRLNQGYGYPVSDFLYPGFLYIGSLVHILGFNFVTPVKIILGISLIASALFSFLWLRKIFDEASAFIGALIYLYFPYHLYDVYKRGSVGEVLSLAILPFILWQIEKKNIFWSAIGIFLLILAHNTLAVLFMLFIFVYMGVNIYVSKNRKQLLYRYTSISALGLGMGAFFWIPAIFDLQYTVFSKTQISDWSNYFADMNMVGISTFFILLLIFILIFSKKIEGKKNKLTVLILSIGLISIFLASSLSSFVWTLLPASFIQFPFRLLSLAIPSFALVAASAVSVTDKKKKIILGSVIILMAFFSSFIYLFPASYQYFPDSFYSTNQDTTTVKNEYMPKWVKNIPSSMYESKVQNIDGNEVINIEKISANKVNFNVSLSQKRIISVNTIYFPGWEASVNQNRTKIVFDNPAGIINLNLEKGENKVNVYFTETPIRILSNFISLLSLSSLLVLVYLIKYKKLKI